MKGLTGFLFIITLFTWSGTFRQQNKQNPVASISGADILNTQQLMVVVTDGWSNLSGTLYGFRMHRGQWVRQFTIQVVIGRKGLGIGEGLVPVSIEGAPLKKEGDLKSPAGIFTIGTAFGYAENKDASWIKNPYVRATDTLICVDDSLSSSYNTLVNNDPGKSDWKSFEYMHRKDNYYKWGLFINHNAGKPDAGKGSCIFMHIWENDHKGTDGCTAMKEADLLKILHWIDNRLNPLLVQVPKTEYAKLAIQYRLPNIDFGE